MMAAVGKTFEPATGRSAFVSRWWIATLLILLLCSLVLITVLIITAGSGVERGTRALVKAFSKRRMIEPWLSGGFKAGTFKPSAEGDSEIFVREYERGRELITDAMAKDESSARMSYARLLLSR